MKFTLFHLMPYADLDLSYDEKYPTTWTLLPNSYYDPKKGAKLYNRYLDELEYGEELGYDILAVNEHHQNAYGIMPSPIVTASALSRRTTRAKIAIIGSAIPLREHPLQIAEEHAMIDNITEGRLITGFVRGIGAEYHSWGVSPAQSHERFHEAHDLIIQAWTREGPFAFEGKHYHFQYVNVWPRPYSQPHPPIWIPSQGSQETIEWASHPDRRYMYCQTFSPWKAVKHHHDLYREVASNYGYEATGDQLGWLLPIYVGETDEEARKEAKAHFEAFRNKFLKMPFEMLLPPGYLSLGSHQRVASVKVTAFRLDVDGAGGRTRHDRRRQPRDRAPEDRILPLGGRPRESALPASVRHAALRSYPRQHGTVCQGRDAEAAPSRRGHGEGGG